jgi:L-iditol 2-dehydrogenase
MAMWAYAITAPGRLERVEAPVPEAAAGQVLVRLQAGAICGTDLPSFYGRPDHFVSGLGEPGYPLHEAVGEVVAGELPAGTRVVGWAFGHRGLAEYFLARVDNLLVLDDELDAVQATVVQPLSTVLHALDRVGPVAGARAAVIGLGPIGMLFAHALKTRGAAHVAGIDRVDRRELAPAFGLDDVRWDDAAAGLGGEFDVVIEAIGHQTRTLEAAVDAVASGGTVFAFGVPDDTHYPFPFMRFFRRHATLMAGATTDRTHALAAAREYLRGAPGLLDAYLTNVLPVARAQEAFEVAASPARGRLKVALDASGA